MKTIALSICAIALSTTLLAQEKEANEGTTVETVVSTVKVDNGDGVKALQKEVTIASQSALVLDKTDKHKVNQDFKMGPQKVTKTTVIKDGDKIISEDTETYYLQGDQKYTFKQSDAGFSFTPKNDNTIPSTVSTDVETYIIKNEGQECVGYFTDNGSFCVETYNESTGKITKNIYVKE